MIRQAEWQAKEEILPFTLTGRRDILISMENQKNQQVKIGSKFFENELKVYADWRGGWFRECFQNSVDAGATWFNITIDHLGKDKSRVTFADNGCGMTRECLEQVFFILGETGKGGPGDIGGFGKARILVAFAQEKYTLHTHHLFVKGSGADFTIEEIPEHYDGVKLVVDVKADATDMHNSLKEYLQQCYIPGKVFIDGERWMTWTYARNFKRDLSFGKVYTNHSKDARLLVRVNGTLMFSKWITSPAQVILEMNTENSRKVLLANRDGLVWEYARELDSFVAELNIDKHSALKQKRNKSTNFKGTGTFTIARKSKSSNTEYKPDMVQGVIKPRLYHNPARNTTELEEVRTSLDLFDVKIDDDTDNPKIKKVIESYDPRNWSLDEPDHRWRRGETGAWEQQSFRPGASKYKLLLMWKVCCQAVLEIFLNQLPENSNDSYQWGVGWVFSDKDSGEGFKTKARHVKEDDDVHYLLLNPVEDDGTMAYSISKKEDLHRMIVYSVHEICHCEKNFHDEEYASLFTELMALVSPHASKIIMAMKDAKENALTEVVA